jgi:hypothetical protein
MLPQISAHELRMCGAPVIGILFAVDRRDMWGIFIQIGPANAELAAMRIYPFPESFA